MASFVCDAVLSRVSDVSGAFLRVVVRSFFIDGANVSVHTYQKGLSQVSPTGRLLLLLHIRSR